ncbi:MAG: MarR family transcriptional regulator [Burkholderiales bacterium]|nr:MarR family transcriptional regulator [Burkholderiales bacterium]
MRHQVDNVNQPGKSTEPAEVDLLDLIHTLTHQARSRQFQALRDGPHALTHMEAKVLGFFGRRPGATQSDLVQHSGRDKAQVARLIMGLRERGLLAGEADENDRRQQRLTLTADGNAVQRALRQQAKRLHARAVAGLTVAERAQLAALLLRLRANLEAEG